MPRPQSPQSENPPAGPIPPLPATPSRRAVRPAPFTLPLDLAPERYCRIRDDSDALDLPFMTTLRNADRLAPRATRARFARAAAAAPRTQAWVAQNPQRSILSADDLSLPKLEEAWNRWWLRPDPDPRFGRWADTVANAQYAVGPGVDLKELMPYVTFHLLSRLVNGAGDGIDLADRNLRRTLEPWGIEVARLSLADDYHAAGATFDAMARPHGAPRNRAERWLAGGIENGSLGLIGLSNPEIGAVVATPMALGEEADKARAKHVYGTPRADTAMFADAALQPLLARVKPGEAVADALPLATRMMSPQVRSRLVGAIAGLSENFILRSQPAQHLKQILFGSAGDAADAALAQAASNAITQAEIDPDQRLDEDVAAQSGAAFLGGLLFRGARKDMTADDLSAALAAKESGARLRELGALAQESQLRTRSQPVFESFARTLAPPQAVTHVSRTRLRAHLDGQPQAAQSRFIAQSGIAEQLLARPRPVDIQIPAWVVISRILTAPEHAPLIDDIRLSPAAMSPRAAAALEAARPGLFDTPAPGFDAAIAPAASHPLGLVFDTVAAPAQDLYGDRLGTQAAWVAALHYQAQALRLGSDPWTVFIHDALWGDPDGWGRPLQSLPAAEFPTPEPAASPTPGAATDQDIDAASSLDPSTASSQEPVSVVGTDASAPEIAAPNAAPALDSAASAPPPVDNDVPLPFNPAG